SLNTSASPWRSICVTMWSATPPALRRVANLTFACAVKRRWSSVRRKTHPGTGSLHPVAIGAVVEVTKLLKPLV
ncbi:MAG TPA: hypothetical protein VFJ47_15385, partial [Terriglobales bacterium]|nr:hypothetical protein [Terriglobales bacterium]